MLDPELLVALPFALRIEIAENVARKDFTQSELAEIQRVVIEHWSAARYASFRFHPRKMGSTPNALWAADDC